jgi:hypothetical protein
MDQNDATSTLRYSSDPDPQQSEAVSTRIKLSPPNGDLPVEQRRTEVIRLAQEAFAKTGSWVVFYREMLGGEGIVRQLFTKPTEMRAFEESSEFAELQEMVAAMRSEDSSKGDATEPERMITIRLPKSLHDALRLEADEMNLSINKLCISKLLQRIESRFVPIQQGRRRGRRPGPQGPRKKLAQDTTNNSQTE